jgi:hypothetical protein
LGRLRKTGMDLRMFDNFQPKGAHRKRKLTLDIHKKYGKNMKIKNFGRFAYGPTRFLLRL